MPSREWISNKHNQLSAESAKSPETFNAMWNFKYYKNPPHHPISDTPSETQNIYILERLLD